MTEAQLTASGYLARNLLDGERIVRVARFHWLYTVSAVAWLVMSAAFSIWIFYFPPSALATVLSMQLVPSAGDLLRLDRILSIGVFLIGLYRYAAMMIFKISTEIVITDLRLVFKRGLISRTVNSVNVDRIEGADIYQGVIGRILGYGRIAVRGTGMGDIMLPPIDDPLAFRKAVLEVARPQRPYQGN